MPYLHEEIVQLIQKSIKQSIKQLKLADMPVRVEHPKMAEHGDLAVNTAFILAKRMGTNPIKLAEKIVGELKKNDLINQYFDSIAVAPPGFINFRIKTEKLLNEVEQVIKLKEAYGAEKSTKKVLIDYSSPNIAKRFSVGHLRSTLIGQALANFYQFLGWRVVADNHLGDWGTQFGVIIAAVEKYKLDVSQLTILDLEKIYVQYNKLIEKNPKLKETARAAFARLEKGEAKAKKIWSEAVRLSLKEFDGLYQKLEVMQFSPIFSPEVQKYNPIKYVTYGESFYEKIMIQVIKEAKQKGVAKLDAGALIIRFDDKMPPAMLLKSNGTTTYLTRDLATIWFRENTAELKSDLYIYEVGAEQSLHFRQLFKTVEMLGWCQKSKLVHVAHGMIRLPEGKMSTRKGRTVNVETFVDKIINRSRNLITNPEITEAEKEKLSRVVGIGALKYNELKRGPAVNYVFDWEEALNLEGNSGPYLQYTFARCQSVLNKAKPVSLESLTAGQITLSREELGILRLIYQFNKVLRSGAFQYAPNTLVGFLFELAQRYNTFYNNQPILKSEAQQRKIRLALTSATAEMIKIGLGLLGIRAPNRM
ncbi:MAG: arginine--tRNA ligase [bacterium]|nr:arginine--tRNA ligase [bacterium]